MLDNVVGGTRTGVSRGQGLARARQSNIIWPQSRVPRSIKESFSGRMWLVIANGASREVCWTKEIKGLAHMRPGLGNEIFPPRGQPMAN